MLGMLCCINRICGWKNVCAWYCVDRRGDGSIVRASECTTTAATSTASATATSTTTALVATATSSAAGDGRNVEMYRAFGLTGHQYIFLDREND